MNNNKYLPVEGYNHLVRDEKTNAILNTDVEAWETFKRNRAIQRNNKQLIDKIPQLEKDIVDMKTMLELILTKLS